MRILCVAEKPSIARSITEILSSGNRVDKEQSRDKYCHNNHFQYRLPPDHTINIHGTRIEAGWIDVTITSVRGHVMSSDFGDEFKSWSSCNPSQLFEAPIKTEITTDSKHIATNLRQQVRNSDLLMIWTDCDREGEHIGSEIVNICQKVKRNLPVKRAKFSAIIASQIHKAIQHPIELDWNAVAAVNCRIELDLRLGVAFTRLQTVRLQRTFPELQKLVISYGPCQFPTLGFVVEQYIKVMDFNPEPFWYIAVMKKRDGVEVDFRWSRNHLFVEQDVSVIFQRCLDKPEATVTKVQKKDTRKFKPTPLTTVELQKAGGRLLRMAPKTILDVAEKLYQKGFLSYPRTETDQYDPAFDFRTYIDKQRSHPEWGSFASRLLDNSAFEKPNNGKKNDKAHPPIHPTKSAIDLGGEEKRVYEFVTRRFLASCNKHALGKQTNVDLNIAEETFSTTGIVVVERNYLDVYPYDSWGGPALPEFSEGERFVPTKIEKKEGETSRPKLLTEADLVSLMDKNGIGTDATIAEHISRILDRQYVMAEPEGQIKYLVPSTLGMGLVLGHNKIELQGEKSLCKPVLRRETEEKMGLICEGSRTKEDILQESLQEYSNVFREIEGHFNKLTESLNCFLRGETNETENQNDPSVNNVRSEQTPRLIQEREAQNRSASSSRSNLNHTGRSLRAQNTEIDIIDLDDDLDDSFLSRAIEIVEEQDSNLPRSRNITQNHSISRARDAHTNNFHNSQTSESVLCRCNEEAKQLTVQKDGPTKGRPFWTCTKRQNDNANCGFFQWADQVNESPPLRNMNNSRMNQSNQFENPSNVRRCQCELEAKCNTVFKDGANKGRRFWTCPNVSRTAQCKFFEWDDEQGSTAENRRSGGGSNDEDNRNCFNCGQSGHWSAQCTQSGQRNENRTTGLGSSSRPESRRISDRDSAKVTTGSCFNCGKDGHWSNKCPESANFTTSGSRSETKCYHCDQAGHWANECPGLTNNGSKSNRGNGQSRKKGASVGGAKSTKRRKT